MYLLKHIYFCSFLSLSLAAAPPSFNHHHASLQARGGFFSKDRPQAALEAPGTDNTSTGPHLPVVGAFSCRGVDKSYCESSCECNKSGKVICSKRHNKVKLAPGDEWLRKYGTLALTSICGPVCSCLVDGVRKSGGLEIPDLRRLEMLHQHAREGGRYEGKMSGDLDAMGISRSPSAESPGGDARARVPGLPRPLSSGSFGTGDASAGPLTPRLPRSGSSGLSGAADAGTAPPTARLLRPGSYGSSRSSVAGGPGGGDSSYGTSSAGLARPGSSGHLGTGASGTGNAGAGSSDGVSPGPSNLGNALDRSPFAGPPSGDAHLS